MSSFEYILLTGMTCYITGAVLIIISLRAGAKVKDESSGTSSPFVSAIIAAHNEEAAIGACLSSLADQCYPRDAFEVIIADDRSDDGTYEIIQCYKDSFSSLTVIRILETPPGISPKKHALMQAIASSRGEIIMQTDADCIVPPGWIKHMIRPFSGSVGFVAGISPYRQGSGLLNSFIRHEYLWNVALMAGSIGLGAGTHATGRNLAFLRKAFDEAGGYGASSHVLSGDDTLLLQRIQARTGYRAAVMLDSGSHVMTQAPSTFRAFLRQRQRHMSTGTRFNPFAIAAGIVVYGFHILLLAGLLLSPFITSLILPVAAALFLKLCIDAIAAQSVRFRSRLDIQWGRFFVNELCLIAYMAIMPVFGAIFPPRWKENS